VFTHVIENLTLDSLFLNDLREPALIHFPGATRESHFPEPGPVTWVGQKDLETRDKIAYKPLPTPIQESYKASNWRGMRQSWYGPSG